MPNRKGSSWPNAARIAKAIAGSVRRKQRGTLLCQHCGSKWVRDGADAENIVPFGKRRATDDHFTRLDGQEEHVRTDGEGFQCSCGIRSRDTALLALHFARVRRGEDGSAKVTAPSPSSGSGHNGDR